MSKCQWRPGVRSSCSYDTILQGPKQYTRLDQDDDYTWCNTGDEPVANGGIVCILDPATGEPKQLGIAMCEICPGKCGTLLTKANVLADLDPGLSNPIPQGAKIYIDLDPGTEAAPNARFCKATPEVPAIGFSLGCAVIDYDFHQGDGMAAHPGQMCVRVHFDCCHVPELFGITDQDDKNVGSIEEEEANA